VFSEEEGTAMAQFEDALKKLVEDPRYREAVIKDYKRLTTDYKQLEPQDLMLLMQVWHATGHPEALAISSWFLCHCCCGHTR
jgi:hypothetical protein